MRLGDVVNPTASDHGKPLEGVRILAAEQMQALPFATQLLARLGADVVKVEHPTAGESGRGAYPFMTDPEGRRVGATFLRNNLSKRSVGLDLKHAEGRELFLRLAPRFDVVCENFKAGTMDRLGLGYEAALWLARMANQVEMVVPPTRARNNTALSVATCVPAASFTVTVTWLPTRATAMDNRSVVIPARRSSTG